MAGNAAETAIGAVVLAAAAGFLAYAANTTGVSGPTDSYEIHANFRSVEGISLGSDVRLAGVKVGSVTGLELNPLTFRADTTIAVNSGIVLPDDSAIMISSEGLLGGNFVELIPGGSEFNLDPGGEILDTQGAVSLISLLLKFVTGKEE
ncbi:MAG: outer membrane lipid asymmetry maintenance protein MlaD [Rhodobacteraceae bacterium]|nr:outer membrane lipid asymmetry maintenance protein MlaD [Paracoccaceae bacterium]